jgi:hypothetical protein
MGPFPAYYLFNALLYVLQVMHVLWFYVILKVAYNSLSGKQAKDDRSDSGSSSEIGEEANKKKQ